MIKIVLVDDDMLTLTRLKELIHIKNMRIVAEFTQAEKAVEYIRDNQPDILITDMRMPKIDGVELIQMAKKIKPDLEVICVSSYRDFNYVKESFKEGSVDYILKHLLDEENMTNALLQAASHIRAGEKGENSEEAREESWNALKEKVFFRMFTGINNAEETEKFLKKYNIKLDVSSTILLLLEIDDYYGITERFQQEDKRIFLNAVRNIIEQVTAKVPERIIIQIEESQYVVLLSYTDVKSQLYMFSMSAKYAQQINFNMKKLMNVDMSIGVGRLCMTLQDLVICYKECVDSVKNKFFEGKGKVYNNYERPVETKKEAGVKENTGGFQGSKVSQKLLIGDESCLNDVDRVFKKYRELKVPAIVTEFGIVEMLNVGYKVLEEKSIEGIERKENFQVMYDRIKKLETADEMKEAVKKFYTDIMEEIQRKNCLAESHYSKYTIQTIHYVEMNYKNAVSLQEIAEQLKIHYAYLSKVFKQDTGVNFGEYLNKFRIEKAKTLIREGGYRIKEIYAEVGFTQYNYFFKVFRRLEKCTPTEYEKRLKKYSMY